jgi:uncharacterized membrane protein YhaH (DUF805 family)
MRYNNICILGVVMEWFINVIKKYAVFTGRARRKEYWFFIFFYYIIGLILGLLTLLPIGGIFFGIVSVVYSTALIVPTLAVSVRRLHDINRSGFSLFYIFIPLAGIIIILLFMVRDGTPDENQYGPNPKMVYRENLTEKDVRNKRLFIPILVILAVFLLSLHYYLAFKAAGNKESFSIFNESNNNYYLNVVSEKNINQFSFRKHEHINGIKYTYICKSGKYNLKLSKIIFQCERDDAVDISLKLKNIFKEFKIMDENDDVIWDLYVDDMEQVRRIENNMFKQSSIFWFFKIK